MIPFEAFFVKSKILLFGKKVKLVREWKRRI